MWTSEGALKGDIEEDTLRRHLRGTLMEDTEQVKKVVKIYVKCLHVNVKMYTFLQKS